MGSSKRNYRTMRVKYRKKPKNKALAPKEVKREIKKEDIEKIDNILSKFREKKNEKIN